MLDDESLLSLEVRQNLLNLSNFIDKHTIGLITEPDVKKIPTLIEINKNIAAGLFDSLRVATDVVPVTEESAEGSAPIPTDEKISTSA